MNKRGTRFFSPETISELKYIAAKESDIKLLAGGTSLFRTINGDNLILPGAIIVLDNIQELKKENRTERYFEFGSMLTIQEIINSSKRNIPPILLNALLASAPYPVRNVATIGGAIANQELLSDLIPLLLIINCKVEVICFSDKKIRPKWESLNQYISTTEQKGLHLVTRVRIPLINPLYYQFYKTGSPYNIFNEISFSAVAEIEKSTITSLSMAFNLENRKIVRIREIEAVLIGKHVPISHRLREPITSNIISALEHYPGVNRSQKYRMTQIILHFLERF